MLLGMYQTDRAETGG
jgi:hypothetical protein